MTTCFHHKYSQDRWRSKADWEGKKVCRKYIKLLSVCNIFKKDDTFFFLKEWKTVRKTRNDYRKKLDNQRYFNILIKKRGKYFYAICVPSRTIIYNVCSLRQDTWLILNMRWWGLPDKKIYQSSNYLINYLPTPRAQDKKKRLSCVFSCLQWNTRTNRLIKNKEKNTCRQSYSIS